MLSQLIDVIYSMWLLSAFLVLIQIVPLLRLKAVNREFDREFWMATGIFLSWAGGGVLIRGWFLVWHQGPKIGFDTAWMLPNWFVVVAGLVVIAGAVLHIRSFTVQSEGERGWMWRLGLVLTLGIAHFVAF